VGPNFIWIFDSLAILKAEEALLLYDALLHPSEKKDSIISEKIRKSFFKKYNALGLSATDLKFAETQLKNEIDVIAEIPAFLFELGFLNKTYQLRLFRIRNLHATSEYLIEDYLRGPVFNPLLESFEKMKEQWDPSEPGYLEMVDMLVNVRVIEPVEDNIKDWRQSIKQSNSDPSLINQAKIVGKAGHFEEAVAYLGGIGKSPDLNSQQKLDLAKTYFELGLREESLVIAKKLLADPEVDLEAAELMDKLQPGWDDFIPKLGPKELGPYR